MGKVLSKFNTGWPGTVSRVKDDVIVALKNVGSTAIKPGDPVFMHNGVTPGGVRGFINGTTTEDEFVGFAVRVPDKTPETWGSNYNTMQWDVGDVVDVLVRGSTIIACGTSSAKIGNPLYIRKSDAALVTSPGTEGTTIPVPDTYVRSQRDAAYNCEIVITRRHLQ